MVVTTALENPEYTWDQFLNALGGSMRQVLVIFEKNKYDLQNICFEGTSRVLRRSETNVILVILRYVDIRNLHKKLHLMNLP